MTRNGKHGINGMHGIQVSTSFVRRAFFFALPLVSAAAGLAESSTPHEGGGEHHAEIKNLWDPIGHPEAPALGVLAITFLVFVGGVIFFVRPKLAVYLENRSDDVRKAIEEATRAKQAAEERARQAEAKLAALDDEVKRLKVEFEQQGKLELERLERAAHETAARIAKDAEDTIAAETARAQTTLRQEAAKLALEMAEERIRAALSNDDELKLRKSLVDGLERPRA